MIVSFLKITSLIDPVYLPNQTVSQLRGKRKLLQKALATYCGALDGCGIPEPDKPPVRVNHRVMHLIGHQQLSCREGYSLLSCGMDNYGGILLSF